jgi:hypothetical protein
MEFVEFCSRKFQHFLKKIRDIRRIVYLDFGFHNFFHAKAKNGRKTVLFSKFHRRHQCQHFYLIFWGPETKLKTHNFEIRGPKANTGTTTISS